MEREEFRKIVDELWEKGAKVLIADIKHEDGQLETRRLRLFKNPMGSVCYFAKGRRRYGNAISSMGYGYEILSVRDVTPKQKTADEVSKYCADLAKFKKAFTQNAHPNLWQEIAENYAKLDIADFEQYARSKAMKNHFDGYLLLGEYCREKGIEHLVYENHYKTTSIKSHNPHRRFSGWNSSGNVSDYDACVNNIRRHLDLKENFEYWWHADYDMHVSGKLCEDGKYRAWLSAEYKNCGNGHYYLLINENTAVFAEDD